MCLILSNLVTAVYLYLSDLSTVSKEKGPEQSWDRGIQLKV